MTVIRSIVTAWLILGASSALAETPEAVSGLQPDTIYILQGQGLIVTLPAQESPNILQQAQAFHSSLKARRTQCREQVEKTRFKTKDTLLTIILPGGLLYAANKQQQHAQAKASLVAVSQQLTELKNDLDRLQALAGREALALLR